MMRRFNLYGLTVFILILLLGCLNISVKANELEEGIKAISRLQVLIEYYFMQSGRYPASLESLNKSLNSELPKEVPKVDILPDPRSGEPFVYEVSQDRCSYKLSFPKPELYGAGVSGLTSIDWGWLRFAAEGKRIERITMDCTRNVEAIATRCELYAKDHDKAFPANLNSLLPKYMPRELICPGCKEKYIYTSNGKSYTISCPHPEVHCLGGFTYDSEKGLLLKELKAKSDSIDSGAAGQ